RASAEHAVIAWSGERWEVRDLGSLNGTWLDGRRLTACERAAIQRDSRLAFGGGDSWIVADDAPLGPGASNKGTDELVHSASGILALPSPDNPRVTIFRRADGQWLAEFGMEVRSVADRDQLDIDGACWSLFLHSESGRVPETPKADGSA